MAALLERRLFGPLSQHEGPAVLGAESLTASELLRRVDALAKHLASEGLTPGTRIGLCLDPTPEYVVALLAVLRADGVALMLSPTWTGPETDRCLGMVQPSFVVSHGACPGSSGPRRSSALPGELQLHDLRRQDVPPSESGDAVIIFTSGTSGTPKGVVLTESGVLANAGAVREYLGVEAADAAPLFTPTCYAYAVSQVLVQMLGRAPICPIRTGFKYPILILEAIDALRLRGLSANPTSFKMLLKAAADVTLPLDSLRYAMGGGQFLSREVVDGMERRFRGCRVVNQYGCTENSPRIAYHWVSEGEEPLPGKSLPVGKAVAGTEIRISDEGQVLVRGTSLMSRYWQMPEETARRMIDGWYTTGDVGFQDAAGDLVLIGRLSDVINVGNEKVSPGEVEGFLEQAPGVAEAAVFGTDDPLLGEAVEAIVVPRDGHRVSPDEMLRSVRAHLKAFVSAYKMPRRVHLRKALPRNLYGKLDRSRLVAWARDEAS
jgi:acyl-CoA synthetase (AMP-forming)/AMP-acid ligase II